MMLFEEEKEDRFYIAKSKIKGAGRGLFASRLIKAHEVLFVTGIMVEARSQADITTSFLNIYKFALNPYIENGVRHMGKYKICPLGYASFVNHDKKNPNVVITYIPDEVSKPKHGDKVIYLFLRDVEKNEEILGNYGYNPAINKPTTKFYKPILNRLIKSDRQAASNPCDNDGN